MTQLHDGTTAEKHLQKCQVGKEGVKIEKIFGGVWFNGRYPSRFKINF
jgi:hypothetical protein